MNFWPWYGVTGGSGIDDNIVVPPVVPAALVFAPRGQTTFDRLELWTDVEVNGGERIGFIFQVMSLETTETNMGEHTVRFTIPLEHPLVRTLDMDDDALPNFRPNQVVRFVKTDGTWTEHRISDQGRILAGADKRREIIAFSILQDAGFRGLVYRNQVNGGKSTKFVLQGATIAEHWEAVVVPALSEAGQSFWELGVVQHAQSFDVNYENDTPLSALRKIAENAGDLELEVVGGTEEYRVNLITQIGTNVRPLIVRARRNLVSLRTSERTEDQANRIYCTGEDSEDGLVSIGDAKWRVPVVIHDSFDSDIWYIGLEDTAGGGSPLLYDGQFVDNENPYYLVSNTAPWSARILAASNVPGIPRAIFTVESTTAPPGAPAGTWYASRMMIMREGGTRKNIYVEDIESVTNYGVRVMSYERADVPATDNFIPNSIGREWSLNSITPGGWSKGSNVTVTRETNPEFLEDGARALRVFTATPQLNSALFAPLALVPYTAQGMLSYFARITVLQGEGVRLVTYVVRASTDINGNATPQFTFISPYAPSRTYYPIEDSGKLNAEDEILPHLTTVKLNEVEDVGFASAFNLSKYPLYGGYVGLYLQPIGTAPVEFILHGVQVTNSQEQQPLLEGTGGNRLHLAALRKLKLYKNPLLELSVDVADLAMASGLEFPYNPIQLGGPIIVEDPDPDTERISTRIVSITRDWYRKLIPSLGLSNERAALSSMLTQKRQTPRKPVLLTQQGKTGRTYEP